MEFSAMTDVGRQRQNNEDNYFVYQNEKLFGGMVADGMGGHNAGEVASKMAVDLIKHYIICNYDPSMDYMEITEMIRTAFQIANREIYRGSKTEEHKGMGTTATLALVYDKKLKFHTLATVGVMLFQTALLNSSPMTIPLSESF